MTGSFKDPTTLRAVALYMGIIQGIAGKMRIILMILLNNLQ